MFERILIANRGEIAARIARTAKRMGLTTIGVYSEADQHSPHVLACDEALLIGPAPVTQSYLNIEAILEAGRKAGAQAVHPGYGLLSENPAFAQAVVDSGMVFVGPKPATMKLLGDKVEARRLAQKANVRVVPGSDDAVNSVEEVRALAETLDFPLLIKAAGGGGGIGMRIVTDESELLNALETAKNRAAQAFADARVFVERYIERPRHVEVQVLRDAAGQSVVLGERECSLQRRHQKILEESPAPCLTLHRHGEEIREALFEAAIRLMDEANYENAGTCEFILDAHGKFYFLEVNARLQVEHPVTEECTGLDLVEWQFRIAAGESITPEVMGVIPSGHAVEARIYAEDPTRGFLPSPGKVDELRFPPGPPGQVRIESGIAAGLTVTPHYDPLVAKVITYAATRHQALLLLDRTLAETVIQPLKTNLSFLRDVLRHESFRAGQYDTTFAENLVKPAKS